MTYRGHIEKGAVIVDEPGSLPEGARVEIAIVASAENPASDSNGPSLYERLEPIIGIANDLPPDGSLNLDHYLYGTDKA